MLHIIWPSVESLSLEDKNSDFVEPASEAKQLSPVPSDTASRVRPTGNTFSARTDMVNETSSQANIVRILTLRGISEKRMFSDARRFPSVHDRRKAKFRTDLNAMDLNPCSEQWQQEF